MIHEIKADLFRYEGEISLKQFVKQYLLNPSFRYTFYLRICHHLRAKRLVLPLLLFEGILTHYIFKYSFQIYPKTEIGPGLFLGHFGGIVINSQAIIGENVNIEHGVTIGQANRGKRQGNPTIGNQVWVGAHAIVVGKITVGDGALIGPGAYVNFDVPENAVVIGNPGQIISYAGTEGYVTHPYPSRAAATRSTAAE